MSIVEALKALAKAITGKDADGNTVDEVLLSFAANYDAGGGNLPEVTAADNGKVLKVAEGEWTAVLPV